MLRMAPKRSRMLLPVALAALVASAGCHLVTEPSRLQDFQWIAVENPSEVQEGIDAVAFAGDIDLLGQMKKPTLCFKLEADFDRNGSTLTVHVNARSSQSANCDQQAGGYRYTALLRGLGSGKYTLHVVHSVPGVADREFSKDLEIR